MNLATLMDRIPFLRRAPRGPGGEPEAHHAAGAGRPVRNPLLEWSEDPAGNVILQVPLRNDRLGRIVRRIAAAPEFRRVELDEVGSDVWRMCDGEHTVDAIRRALAAKYRLDRREVEVSLALYLRQLARRGYLGVIAPGDRSEGREESHAG